jgi:hypothetical protein
MFLSDAKKPGIDLRDRRAAGGYLPTVERSQVDAGPKAMEVAARQPNVRDVCFVTRKSP